MTVIVENAGPGQLGQRVVGSKPIPVRGMGSRVIGNVIPDAVFVASGTGNIGRATSKTLKDTSTDAFETQLNVSAIDEPIRVILGRCRVGAHIPRVLSSGSNLVVVCLWGRGECDAVESITMGGASLPSGSSVTHYTGTQVQTVNATLVSAFSGIGVTWTNALLGFCYSVVTLPPRNSGGVQIDLADFHAIVRGLKCYDPRDGGQVYATPSTWLYTNCPALLTARVLTDTTLGLGMTPTSAFWSDVTTVANANDTALSGGEKKRVLNLCMENQQPAESWVKTLAQYAGAFVVPEGSIFRLIADGTASSVETITEANMVEGSFSWQKRDIRKRPNVVYVRFTEPQATGDWIPSIAPIGVDVPSVPSGEQLRGQIVEMPGVTSYSQANRESIERRNHLYLEDLEMSFTLFDEGLELQLGDVITVSYGALFTSKLMRIMGISSSDVGLWQINCAEYDPASYSTVVATSPTYTDTGLASPNSPPTVTGLVLTEIPSSTVSGALPRSQIDADWDSIATTYPFFHDYHVLVYDNAGALLEEGFTASNTWRSREVLALRVYSVAVKARSSIAEGSALAREIMLDGSVGENLTPVFSTELTKSGWSLINCSFYTLYPGDPTIRIATRNDQVDNTYNGATVADGHNGAGISATAAIDDQPELSNPIYQAVAVSPQIDIGAIRSGSFVALAESDINDRYVYPMQPAATANAEFTLILQQTAMGTPEYCYAQLGVTTGARYVTARIQGIDITAFGDATIYTANQKPWAYEFTPPTINFLMATSVETKGATTSASATTTVTLANKYVAISGVQVTAESATQANPTYSNVSPSETLDNTVDVDVFDSADARIVRDVTITVTGVRA